MLKIRKISEIIGKRVFTDGGDEFGEIEEANLLDNRIDSWRVRLNRSSTFSSFLGSAKGIVIPHQYVKSIGDVVIVSKAAVPTREEEAIAEE